MPDISKIFVSKNVLLLKIETEAESFSPLTLILVKSFFSLHYFVLYLYCIFLLRNWNFSTSYFPYVKGFNKILAKKKKKNSKLKFIKEYVAGKQYEIGNGKEEKFCFKIVPSIDTPW